MHTVCHPFNSLYELLHFCREAKSYIDLQKAANRGCQSFVSIGRSLDNGTLLGLVLGFPNPSDCAASGINIATQLLDNAATECLDSISDILQISTLLLSPPPTLKYMQQTSDDSLDSDSDDAISDEENGLIIARPDVSYNLFTLHFTDPALEDKFAIEHNASLLKLDAFGFFAGFLYTLCLLFLPSTKYNTPGLTKENIQCWRCFLLFAPSLLLFSRRTRQLYVQHREFLLAYTFLTTALWLVHVENYMRCLEAREFTRWCFMNGFLWLAVYSFVFQMRLRILLPVLMLCFAINVTLMPRICLTFYPEVRRCVALQTLKVLGVSILAPGFLMWWLENWSRESFIRKVLHEAAVS